MSRVISPETVRPAQELDRLVEQYQVAVLRTCYLYLHDRSQAEDAVQETFLKVYRNLDRFRGECSEKNWTTFYYYISFIRNWKFTNYLWN